MSHKSLKSMTPAPRTMAPSQKAKMVRVEYTEAQVIRCIACQDYRIGSLQLTAHQYYFLVRSDRFPGYYYAVTWNEARTQYDCSCGNPRCTAHTAPVSAYVHAHAPATEEVAQPAAEVAPVAASDDWQENPRIIGSRAWREVQDAPRREAKRLRDAKIQAALDKIASSVNADLGRTLVHRGLPQEQKEVA